MEEIGTSQPAAPPVRQHTSPPINGAWLRFILLLLLLLGGGLWLNAQASQRADALRQQQQQTAVQLAADQQRQALLVNYLNTISDMLNHDKLLQAKATDVTKLVADAQTLETLRQLDPERKATLLRFLYDTKLINNDYHVVSMVEADLHAVHFPGIDLRDTQLSGANLSGADLHNANLSFATLVFTNLSGANLAHADLQGCDVHNTDFSHANLSGANLKDLVGISTGLLEKASSLAGATMPDGSIHR